MAKPRTLFKLKAKNTVDLSKFDNYDLYMLRNEITDNLKERVAHVKEYITPTQVGEDFNLNAANTNKLLARMGLQQRIEIHNFAKFWMPTDKGRQFCEVFETSIQSKPSEILGKKSINYDFIRNSVKNGYDKWSNYTWLTLSVFNVRWKPEVISVVGEFLLAEERTRNSEVE